MAYRMTALALATVVTTICGCTGTSPTEPVDGSALCDEPAPLPAHVKEGLVEPGFGLSVGLYKRLAKTEKGSFVFSPFGVRATLALSAAGAKGETAQELAEGLAAKGGLTPKWHRAFGAVQAQVLCPQGERSRRIEFASGLFLQDGVEVKEAFSAALEQNYASRPFAADFRDGPADAREDINSWVDGQTRGKISSVVTGKAIDKKTRLVLVSGMTVSDRWSAPFAAKDTRPEAFHVTSEKAKKTAMMHQLETLPLVKADDHQALLLPTERERTSLVVFLPNRIAGLRALESKLSAAMLKDTLKQLKTRSSQALVEVSLPRFRLQKFQNLTNVLMALGIQKPFLTGKANFTGIDGGDQKLFVGAAMQRSSIDVSEGGLEMQGAEPVDPARRQAQPERAATFNADHPFLFAVLDNATSELLYLGRVVNPSPDGN